MLPLQVIEKIKSAEMKSISYITPILELIELEVETAILVASGGNVENPVEGEESDW